MRAARGSGSYRDAMGSVGNDDGVTGVRISTTSGRVEVVAEDRSDVAAPGATELSRQGSILTISCDSGRHVVRVPIGVDVFVGTTSGRVDVVGRVGNLGIVTESGRVRVEHAASLDVRTSSASIEIGRVDGDCRIRSTSGHVEVGACCDADVATTSGRIDLNGVIGTAKAHCVSGRIDIEMDDANDVEAETVSGRVSVSMPAGSRVRESPLPGEITSTDDESDCTVSVRSVTGRIDISSR